MLEILIISAIITGRLYARDRMYAKQGLPPPSSKLVDAWLARRNSERAAAGKKPVKPARYGMWRYFWQRWQALWEVLAEDHKAKHAQYLKDRAEARRTGAPAPVKPSLKERLNSGWQWVVDKVITPVGGRAQGPAATPATDLHLTRPGGAPAGPVITCDECGTPLIDRNGGWRHPDGSTCSKAAEPSRTPIDHRWACETCPASRGGYATESDAQAGGQRHINDTHNGNGTVHLPQPNLPPAHADENVTTGTRGPSQTHGNDPDDICRSVVALAVEAAAHGDWEEADRLLTEIGRRYPDAYHVATVPAGDDNVPLPVWHEHIRQRMTHNTAQPQRSEPAAPPTEGDNMTATTTQQTSGEVTGLMSAINYAEAVAGAHEAHSLGGGEQYMTSLGQAKVGPDTIASAAAAQEATEIAAAAWRAHAEKLREQLAAKEATTAETGTKEFLLSE